MKTVAIAGTFDSKGTEFLYIKKKFESLNIATYTIHVGAFEPTFQPDVSNSDVFDAAGVNAKEIIAKKDRGLAVEALSKGIKILLPELYRKGKFDGVISLGGSGGTSLMAPAMQTLPIGVPKIMVSTVASGNVEKYIGTSDIIMMPSIVDVSGINNISETIFTNAVFAMAGMLEHERTVKVDNKPMIAASMFGVTTPCINKAKEYLEKEGYEVLVFHATGTGGKTMESLIRSGYFKGVLDLTTTEWCDEIVGGELAAGRQRGEAASVTGVPQVVSIGATDMVNFGPRDTIPSKFKQRKFYQHNTMVTLMRTTKSECAEIGNCLSEKWNMANPEKISVILPQKGVSMIDAVGQPFWDPEADKAMIDEIKGKLKKDIKVIEMDCNINEDNFALTAAKELITIIKK